MTLEPNDLPITHEDHLFDDGKDRTPIKTSIAKIRSMDKYYQATEAEFLAIVSRCSANGDPLSLRQQHIIRTFLITAYQDGMIAALREQTDRALKGA